VREKPKRQEREKGERKALTRISLRAREESMRGGTREDAEREKERRVESGRPEKRALVLSLPHAAGVANPSLSTIYQ